MKNVAIIGTVGVPANYGGFETLVENIIGENCSDSIQYTVFCSSKNYHEPLQVYKGAALKYVPLHANGSQSIPYDIWSMIKCGNKYDVVLILGVSGCIFLPVYRLFCKKKIVINIDGLEHRRGKWGKWTKRFLKWSEKMAIRYADTIITDNKGIQDYVKEEYGKDSEMIAYGGDHALREVSEHVQNDLLDKYHLKQKEFALSICRIEPENNCHVILEAFSKTDKHLVFIGNWERSDYGRDLLKKYNDCANIQMLSPIYDLDTLYALRSKASHYIHGHSAGGTNPSLVEAMFFARPILAFDVVYNRETTQQKAYYFKNEEELIDLLQGEALDGKEMAVVANSAYTWKKIAKQYEKLY